MNMLQGKLSAAINQCGFIDTLTPAEILPPPYANVIAWHVRKITFFFCHLFLVLLPFNWHCLLHKLRFIKDSFILVNPFFPPITTIFQIQSKWAAGIILTLFFSTAPVMVQWRAVVCHGCDAKSKSWLHRVTSEIFAICFIKILFQKLLIRAKHSSF